MGRSLRTSLLGLTSTIALLGPSALAQQAPESRPRTYAHGPALEQVIVTAQKRSQRLQDVPIAVTAITAAKLTTNRITTVEDLVGAAPNVTVRQAAGSAGLPSFTIRGTTSYGVVPGSDKEASIYLDGVYIGSPYAETFELPDIQRIEVLRGPQGTLFGRNATTGAISVVTRDPPGVLGGRQEFTAGNYGQFRTRTTIDTPTVGPFSGYFSFVHNQRDGDIENLGAGTTFIRNGSEVKEPAVQTSPKRLGDHDGNSYFVALKYQPNDDFRTVYKFDYAEDHFTPQGVAAIAVDPSGVPFPGNLFLAGVLGLNTGNYILDPSARRPDAVNNAYSTDAYEKVYGHNLTTTYQVSDSISLKNIFAYRDSFIYANTQLDGLGGLNYSQPLPGGGPGNPFELLSVSIQSEERQISDEMQANYTSKYLTLTSGLLYYHQNGYSGGPRGYANNVAFGILFGGVVPQGSLSTSDNRSTSVAGYTQAEIHITHQLDLVGGIRVTADHKGGDFVSGEIPDPLTGVLSPKVNSPFVFNQTKPAYTIGLNYKVAPDILVYGKFSDSFVSGGSVGAVSFKAETAKSFEAGGKADFFNHRLRTNLAVFNVDYDNLQSAQSGTTIVFTNSAGQTVNYGNLGTVIVNGGNENARGAEFELTAKPLDPITIGGSLGYTDAHATKQGPLLAAIFNNDYQPTLLPTWDATITGEYDSPPVYKDAHMTFNIDADWRSKERTLQNSQLVADPDWAVLKYSPQSWIVNTRVALVDIPIGSHTAEIAGWARNLTNNKLPTFPLGLSTFALSSTFQAARTYGVDINFQF